MSEKIGPQSHRPERPSAPKKAGISRPALASLEATREFITSGLEENTANVLGRSRLTKREMNIGTKRKGPPETVTQTAIVASREVFDNVTRNTHVAEREKEGRSTTPYGDARQGSGEPLHKKPRLS